MINLCALCSLSCSKFVKNLTLLSIR
jgi:hypothetical protein